MTHFTKLGYVAALIASLLTVGRGTAPDAATESLFMGAGGKPMAFSDAVVGGRAVGWPSAVRMLEMARFVWLRSKFRLTPKTYTS